MSKIQQKIRQGLADLSFPTVLCLLIFLLLAVKTGLYFHSNPNDEVKRIQKREEQEETVLKSLPNQADTGEDNQADTEGEGKKSDGPEVSVLITTADGEKQHEAIELMGTDDFTITSQAGADRYQAGTAVQLGDYFSEKKIACCSISCLENGPEEKSAESTERGIRIISLEKGGISPVYPGTVHFYQDAGNKNFYVVNTLPMESYLPGVVSSEMPDTFGLEALKTQAVCARSYALSVLEAEKTQTAAEGAVSWQVTDTTDDQVYRSGPVDELAKTACEQTRGQVLTSENTIVKPHYYSTSWGKQADERVFFGEQAQLLQTASAAIPSQKQILEMNEAFMETYDLLEQAGAKAGKQAVYDQESPWFRWNCRIPVSRICEKAVKEITITQRGTGGYVSEMLIDYEDGTAEQISGAKAVRERLGFESNQYDLQDGSVRSGLSILPSAFFYLENPGADRLETGGLQEEEPAVRLYGGGFGHGYGMSQYGAAKMAETGHKYTEILSYYYKSAQVREYY